MLKDQLDWDRIMQAPRYAGGHEEVMECLFKGAEVVAKYIERDYQGDEAYAYKLADGSIAIVCDSFGSCSGCDSWEYSTDDEARMLCTELANNAHVFKSYAEAIAWIERSTDDKAAFFCDRRATELLPALSELAQEDKTQPAA